MKKFLILILFSLFINIISYEQNEDDKYVNLIFDLFTYFLTGMSKKNESECVKMIKYKNINQLYQVSNNEKKIKQIIKGSLDIYDQGYGLGEIVSKYGLDFFSIKKLGERCRYIHAIKAFKDHDNEEDGLPLMTNLENYINNNAQSIYDKLKNVTDNNLRYIVFGEIFSDFLNFTVY